MRQHVRSAVRTALVVGTVLTLVNQWGRLRAGAVSGELVARITLNFLVPLIVSVYSRVALIRERDAVRGSPPNRRSSPSQP